MGVGPATYLCLELSCLWLFTQYIGYTLTMATIDPTPSRDSFGYFLTLTSPQGWTAAQVDQVLQWHRRKCENCLLVAELHQSGETHYHSSIIVLKPKATHGVTRQLDTLYKQMGIPVINRVTHVVKSTSDQVGLFHYLTKQLKAGKEPLLLMGWQFSWIKKQCISNVKKIPRKMLMDGRIVLNAANAIPYCLNFAEAAGIGITGRDSFKTVVKLMVKDGYSFDNTKLAWLYSQLLCICGDDRALDQQIDNQLSFLDQ